MKLRLLAMATVAAAALSTPAMAGDGWYLGLGGGWDNQVGYNLKSVTTPTLLPGNKVSSKDSAIGALAIGYKWEGGFRLENEFAFTQHDTTLNGTGIFAATGGNQITSDMVNLVYDLPLSDTIKLSLGGGLGVGGFRGSMRTNGTNFDIFRGGHSAFQWQLIAGLSASIAPDVDLFGEYRYRENETDTNFASSYAVLSPIHISSVQENVLMVGLRWFMTPPPPPPPPPPPDSCVVPNVLGMHLGVAKQRIREANCSVGTVSHVRVPRGLRGRVVGQSPPPGTVEPPDFPVDLSVGRG